MTKIAFTDSKPSKVVELPSFKGSQVEVFTDMTVAEQRAITKEFPKASDASHPDAEKAGRAIILRSIKSWNFVENKDGKDVDMAITEENLERFCMRDLKVLLEAITGKSVDDPASEKKS